MTREEILALANQRLSQGAKTSTPNPYVTQANEMLSQQQRQNQEKALAMEELRRTNPDLAQATENPQEMGFADRAAVSLPSNDSQKFEFMQRKFGQGNVKQTSDGVIFRPSNQDKWTFVDRKEFTAADIADLIGPAIETVPPVVAGVATSAASPLVSVPVAAGVSAASNAVRQGVSKAVTGEERPIGDRFAEAAVATLMGAVPEAGFQAAKRYLTPAGKAAGMAKAAGKANPEATAEGLALKKEFDVPLTLGQVTQSQEALQKESLQRQVGSGGDLSVKALFDRKDALTKAGDKLAEQISGGPVLSAPKVAKALEKVRSAKLSLMNKTTAEEAERLFDAVPQDAKINTAPFHEMADKLIARYSGSLQTKTGKAVVDQLKEWKASVGDWMTAKDLQLALSQFGEYRSTGDIMKDISAPTGRKVGKAVLRSLYETLDRAATQDVGTPAAQGAAAALKEARDAYKTMMTAMEETDNALLRKSALLKKQANPGSVIDSIARGRTFDPDDIAKTLAIADEVKPEFSDKLRGVVIERMLTSGSGEQMSGGMIANKLTQKDNAKMLDALFATKPEMRAKIDRFAKVARLSTMGPYREGSQTTPLLATLASAGPVPAAVPFALWKQATNLLTTSKTMSRLMQTSEGVDILFELTKPTTTWYKEGAKKGGAAVTKLLTRMGEEAVYNVQ